MIAALNGALKELGKEALLPTIGLEELRSDAPWVYTTTNLISTGKIAVRWRTVHRALAFKSILQSQCKSCIQEWTCYPTLCLLVPCLKLALNNICPLDPDWGSLKVMSGCKSEIITRNCMQFRITVRSMGIKCDGQRNSLTVQLNLRLVRRTELVRFSCSDIRLISFPTHA